MTIYLKPVALSKQDIAMVSVASDKPVDLSTVCFWLFLLMPHNMPECLQETLDFVAYVAKDDLMGRACHVLECGGGLSEDVITTIGQAFELRFKEYLKKQPKPVHRYINLILSKEIKSLTHI